METTWGFILERFIIHMFSGAAVLLLALLAFLFLERAFRWFPRFDGIAFFAVPGLVAVFCIFLREPFDVQSGWWVGKSYIDVVSWICCVGLAIWALLRLHEQIYESAQAFYRKKNS